jgi:hypothetical protein
MTEMTEDMLHAPNINSTYTLITMPTFKTSLQTAMMAAIVMLSMQSHAVEFCVVSGMGTNCGMTDANFCRQQAAALNGACVVKVESTARRTNNSNAPFCVTSVIGGTDCSYSDINFCKQQANTLGGACIVNQQR